MTPQTIQKLNIKSNRLILTLSQGGKSPGEKQNKKNQGNNRNNIIPNFLPGLLQSH